MKPKKYITKKGDSWIQIANKHGIGLPDLLYWNGIDPESNKALPTIHPETELYISDPYVLPAAAVTTDAPKDYIDYGETGRELINNYAIALQQKAINLNQVPKQFQAAVYKKYITNGTDQAAKTGANVALNVAAFLADPVGYTLATIAQKGLAYTVDKVSGRNEYDSTDLLKYTPIAGREYTEEHPDRSTLIDLASGLTGGWFLRNIPRAATWVANNASSLAQNAVRTTGLQRDVLTYPIIGSTSGGKYKSVLKVGKKRVGKNGNSSYAAKTGGYKPKVSVKSAFSHQDTGVVPNSGGQQILGYITPGTEIPVSPYIPTTGWKSVTGPIYWNNPTDPNITVDYSKPMHIKETQSWSNWQGNNPSGETPINYTPGTGIYTIRGEAPIGNTVHNQALTKESTTVTPGYTPRYAGYTTGTIQGTPTNVYSGLGIVYNSSSPKSLIIE